MMYQVISNHLTNARYTAQDAAWRIAHQVAAGQITEQEAAALQAIADARAIPDDAPPVEQQLADLKRRVSEMSAAQEIIARAAGVTDAELSTAARQVAETLAAKRAAKTT